jgi:1-acyl-sn-glycerol-3-phosphate acyltransferase
MLYRVFKNLFKLFFMILGRLEVIGQENIPATGPVIVAANHVSNWDPLVLGGALDRKVHFIAKEELFNAPLIGSLMRGWGMIRVKRGRGDREAIAKSLEVLGQDQMLGIFIEGSRNRENSEQMQPPQSGTAMLAVRSGAPVVPVALVNTKRLFQKMQVIIGPPLTFEDIAEITKKGQYQRIGARITTAILSLKSDKA